MGLAGANVVAIESPVEGSRLGERLDSGIGADRESPAPGLLPAHGVPFSINSSHHLMGLMGLMRRICPMGFRDRNRAILMISFLPLTPPLPPRGIPTLE